MGFCILQVCNRDGNVAMVEIYNRIDDFSDENKTTLALSLKTYWEAHGKWEKKDCSNKQLKKVQKVKNILG